MFLSLWNYLRGYVMIDVIGFSVERFMNMAVHRGVYIWDISMHEGGGDIKKPPKKIKRKKYNRRTKEFVIVKEDKRDNTQSPGSTEPGSGAVSMKVSVKGFRILRPCAKKTKCKIKIKKKYGFPFLLFRYRKRKFLAAGVLFFVFALYFLSSFIWLVHIQGASRISQSELEAFLKSNGVYAGAFKRNLSGREIEKELLKHFTDISWVNVNITGTKATITLTEIKPKAEIIDKSTPCNIVAKKDGLIMSIATSVGTPKVKQGDVVREGDILVSSELVIGNEETGISKQYVHATAEIKAKMYYELSIDVPLAYEEREYTGNSKKEFAFIIMDNLLKITRANPQYLNYEQVHNNRMLHFGKNYPLPLVFAVTEYREFEMAERSRTVPQAEAIGYEMVTDKILKEFDSSVEVTDKKISYTEIEGAVRVAAYITTIERIDVEQLIETQPPQLPEAPEAPQGQEQN